MGIKLFRIYGWPVFLLYMSFFFIEPVLLTFKPLPFYKFSVRQIDVSATYF